VNVREATFDLFRRRGLTTMFANPGSTEVPFLTGLPDDLRFVLGLHEGTVVGMATGYAIARDEPALVLLHTTAGLGTAVSGLATARVNRAPLVVVVGQQDRRHLAYEPFLAGRLDGLAGTYPVSVETPAAAHDVPAAIERAYHSAATRRGPALVVVPMGDWEEPADEGREPAAAGGTVHRATWPPAEGVAALAEFLAGAKSPAIVVGAGADSGEAWAALVELAGRLAAPVWQEPFGGRAGFPQDHPLYQGVLPSDRPRVRETLAPHDRVLVVGAPVFRQTGFQPGRFADAAFAVVTDDPDEAHRSPAEVTVLAPPSATIESLVTQVAQRDGGAPPVRPAPPDPGPAESLTASHVLAALAERLPRNTVVLEEAPVDRPDIHARLPAREPLGYLSAAQGGLGFAMPAAAGVKMALPERPVVAIVGDGSALYGVHAGWSAAHYGIGPLWVVLSNGGYVVMDRLAEKHGGGAGPWPGFGDVEVAAIARGFGCPAERITTHDQLTAALDEVVPTLATRTEPLLLDMVVAPTETFQP
jgi:benzoylformate decarboxylase